MRIISVQDLTPSGHELFHDDSESYLNELSDYEFLGKIQGGSTPCCLTVVATAIFSGMASMAVTFVVTQ
jgi:hypothetical protein